MARAPAEGKQATSGEASRPYLIAYNFLSFVAWSYVLLQTALQLYSTGWDTSRLYNRVGSTLIYVQTAALLEVVHSILGFVQSPLKTIGMQVFSRVMLVWGVLSMFPVPEVRQHPAFTSMTLAWSITECVRYAYYVVNLMNMPLRCLVWCRYTFFYALYPIGAGSEAILIYHALSAARSYRLYYYYYLVLLLFSYPPAFTQMYTHMIAQRRKYLQTSGKSKKAK